MEEMTTLKISKNNLNKLHGCRGYLEYIFGKKHTLDDTVGHLVNMFDDHKPKLK
jgi:hypothetical protein